MRATLSRDGELRFNFNVQFRIGRETMAYALIYRKCDYSPEAYEHWIPAKWPRTRSEMRAFLLECLKEEGLCLTCSKETPDNLKDLEQQAFAHVDKLFPELKLTVNPNNKETRP